jgi:hypothetical protein
MQQLHAVESFTQPIPRNDVGARPVSQNDGMDDLIPERPRDAGVPEEVPADGSTIEGARLLGNEVRDRLHADGFTDRQIDQWAETFIAEVGSGSAEDFIVWISRQEHT